MSQNIYFNFLKNPNDLIYKETYNLIDKNIEDKFNQKILEIKKELKEQILKELKEQIRQEILEDITKMKENWTLV